MNAPPALKILIADDEAPARSRLRELLEEMPEVTIVGEAGNGRQALALTQETMPDVLLLDIRMPQLDGIETAGHLLRLSRPPAVIFTTAYDTHALQAFDMNAVDYLLKPIRRERLVSALNKARALGPAQLERLRPLLPQRSHFSVTERGRILLIPVVDVLYLRAELKYITLRTAEREYLLDDSLTHIEKEFPETFVRLHRNCLAARSAIRGFERRHETEGEGHWVALLHGLTEALPISRRQQHLVHEISG